MKFNFRFTRPGPVGVQKGSSLIIVLIMLSITMVVGLISTRLALFSERSARNDRDRQIAFQSAEAALLDAELDMLGPNTASGKRVCTFDSKKPAEFVAGCGTLTKTGMCQSAANPGEGWKDPAVLPLYTSETGDSTSNAANKTVEYGQFTAQKFALPVGSSGLPVRLPRYTIEAVRYTGTGQANDNVGSSQSPEYAFLVTAMGFGTRIETQVMLQALIYKPANKPGAGC